MKLWGWNYYRNMGNKVRGRRESVWSIELAIQYLMTG